MLTDNLKLCRKYNELTQAQVAEFLGVDRTTYCCYESGKIEPDVYTLAKLAKIYNITIDDLIKGLWHEDSAEDYNDMREPVHEFYNMTSNDIMNFTALNGEEKSIIMMLRSSEDKEKILDIIRNNYYDSDDLSESQK